MTTAKKPPVSVSTVTGPWIWVAGVLVTAFWPYWAFHGLGPVAAWVAEGVWLALAGTVTVLILVATAQANQRRATAAKAKRQAQAQTRAAKEVSAAWDDMNSRRGGRR